MNVLRTTFQKLDSQFTKFALWVDEKVENRNLLGVPQRVWILFQCLVYFNVGWAAFTFLSGVTCFTLGLQWSTFYTKVNCDDGINIWIPLNNVVASWTGLFAIRSLHIRWSAFVHFVFTVAMTPLMIFASIFATLQIDVWREEQRLSRGDKDWGSRCAIINLIIAVISSIDVLVSLGIIAVYCIYWIPRENRNRHD